MNNQREIYEALLAGETVFSVLSTEPSGSRVKLNNKGVLVWVESGCEAKRTFEQFQSWEIYKEPKWYENIPEGGVLCWTDKYKSSMTLITVYVEYQKHPFKGHCSHENPNPLTKSEIQAFIDSAPQ